MGCISSTKKLNDLTNEGVFRFRVHYLQPNSNIQTHSNGWLELNPRELIFTTQNNRESVIWSLQHLRRYGVNGEIFSFEAGRRCLTGPGIFVFRCQQADLLYHKFQQYVNSMGGVLSEDSSVFPIRDHPSHTLGRPESNPHTNNYLEPTPLSGVLRVTTMRESFSSSPLSLELDSPDSVPSLSFTNEVVHFQSHPSTPALCANANSNVYLETPLGAQLENNNNSTTNVKRRGLVGSYTNGASNFNSLGRKTLMKRCSLDAPLDAPPEECAPMLNSVAVDPLHLYANVDGLGNKFRNIGDNSDPAERCYENLNRLDCLPLLQKKSVDQQHTKATQTLETATAASGGVNYIVLDLEPPRSPAQCSPKTACFGSDYSLMSTNAEGFSEVQSLPTVSMTPTVTNTKVIGETELEQVQQRKEEISQGYSTIDFIKTCALIKSSTHSADFDHDQEESRITRHSKCVRKAFSISE